ncbi:four and a half LIM domains protein limpet isoform X2 [Colletes latitarsis]|uniref:four and a half LIM domains protein limpet isoform X2 n=1 Tax=Colletes latitarsis TaxID=2605962 RepID=UPI0040375781
MMSRPRGSSIKDGARLANDRFRDEEDQSRSCKNGSNRYHFGMTRPRDEEASRNGRDHRDHSDEDADALYKKSRQHFGAWDFKDIVQDDRLGQRKQTDRFEDPRLTNGRSRNDVDREQSRRSRRKEGWEDAQRADERDQLLREIENLAVEGRSPDRRIRAMIERFKTREEDKLRSRRERDEQSPEKDGSRSKSVGRGDARNDHEDRVNDRGTRIQKDDRESGRLKIRETEHEEAGRSRSVDRRADKFNGFEDSRRNNGSERSHRRRSRELEDEGLPRRKDSPKRRSYAYEGNPEDFDVRIQRYERALLEPRRDAGIEQKASLEDHDRQATRKSSFKKSRDRESSLGRKASFKNSSRDVEKKYFGKDPNTEHASRKNSFKEGSDYGRIASRNRDDEEERKNPSKGHAAGVSRITFKERSSDLGRKNSFKEKTVEFAGVSYEDQAVDGGFKGFDDSRKRHSPNGRYVEFGTVSFQTQDEEDQDKDWSTRRRPSARSKSHDSFEKRSDRHSRPLTPPKRAPDPDPEGSEDPRAEDFDARSWHESNRHFAVKYLRENGRFRSNPEGHSEIERDPSPETGLQEFTNDQEASFQDDQALTRERNGATIIRIRSSPETTVERRRRRRPPQDTHAGRRRRYDAGDEEDDSEEDEDEHRRRRSSRGVPTPSRRIWNYREGGVLITDVEEGQPCLQCGETCSGFSPHTWRKNCTSCKCPREAHDVCHEEWVSVRSRLGLKGDESSLPVGFDPRKKGLAWAPPGLPAHKVEEYFSMLPEISVPRLGTPGERYRDRQLAIQLPKQDLATAYCRHLNPKRASSADDFMAARNEIALDIGNVQEVLECDIDCGACHAPLEYGSLAVSASKLDLLYHPRCFRCSECKELLVDLAYCVHYDTLFCERHYAEQLKPRCAACDELIFSGEYTKAMNKDWHSGHFCCWQCDESLTGQRYVLRDEHPYCIKCYESVFANGCEECNKIIGIDSKDLSYKDKHWHEACFLCNRCRVSLVDKQFGSKVDKIYCGNCYDAQFASRCDGCGEIFRAGTKKMEYKTRQWHEKCFCCVVCKNPIGTKSFIPREQEIYCAGCYEDKFATRCVKCNKIITSGGVTYKNEPWHRDCFTCSNCNNSLAGQRFTSRDDKPYCADCFGELFAKRCTACSKPITGIGGTRFISFEDRHWHNDCFICAGCKTSLVGRGFITDNEDIICPECAKMKLM